MKERDGLLLLLFLLGAAALIIFFSPLLILVLKLITAVVCLILAFILFLVIIAGVIHLIMLPYYGVKKEEAQHIYEGRYRIEDAIDPAQDAEEGREGGL